VAPPVEFLNGPQGSRPFEMHVPDFVTTMPIAPQKGLGRAFAEAIDGRRHLALERLAAHLAIGHHLKTSFLLKRHRLIDGPILDGFEGR
jgi:hypothetical protein